ncbi:MAG: ATP-dependent DNA helicase [Fimbriimonadales bacterium]|jgi:ATP-dependent DNA helicase DinG|nr:ATP-dependent DNA helicase [Fimbriimonadales bacterium]
MSATSLSLGEAFRRLEAQAGYEPRPVQRQMAQFVAECIEAGTPGVVEAPTGVGKSLAVLLPAILACARSDKRIVISTYTNVLAEQYWLKDLPFALSLFPEVQLSTTLAMGRSRYACLSRIHGRDLGRTTPELQGFLLEWASVAQEGTESELNAFLTRKAVPQQMMRDLFANLSVPPYCRARACTHYDQCFYYKSRNRAAKAQIVITNHAVVLTDALLKEVSEGEASLLGEYDFLVIDEAHDLIDAAQNALASELCLETAQEIIRTVSVVSNEFTSALESANPPQGFLNQVQLAVQDFSRLVQAHMNRADFGTIPPNGAIIAVAPPEMEQTHAISVSREYYQQAESLVMAIQTLLLQLQRALRQAWEDHKSQFTDPQKAAVQEVLLQFNLWVKSLFAQLERLIHPPEGVSWVEPAPEGWRLCYQPLEVSAWLREHLFSNQPTLLMSATLTIDNAFDFYLQQVGLDNPRTLQLPPVFDYPRQCAIYLPPLGTIPTPPANTRQGIQTGYYDCVAQELTRLLHASRGRALVLFASRAEMMEVYRRMPRLDGIPIYVQGDGSNAHLSQQFRENTHSVLFGLRSFWTGFDAPGETLTNLIIVRLPFEVPTTPSQQARQALLELQGKDGFRDWSLPMVKQQMRQGFGRLIRKSTDKGVVCILDPRIQNRSYGREILANLPRGIPIFNRIEDALRHIGQV